MEHSVIYYYVQMILKEVVKTYFSSSQTILIKF